MLFTFITYLVLIDCIERWIEIYLFYCKFVDDYSPSKETQRTKEYIELFIRFRVLTKQKTGSVNHNKYVDR